MEKSRLKLTLIALLAWGNPLHGSDQKVRVGILPFVDREIVRAKEKLNARQAESSSIQFDLESTVEGSKSEHVLGILTEQLSKYRFIQLVERSQMETQMKELQLGLSGAIDEQTVSKLGKIQGLELLVSGSIDGEKISARVIHVESGRILQAGSILDSLELPQLATTLTKGIETYLCRQTLKSMRNDSPNLKLEFGVVDEASNQPLSGNARIGQSVRFKFEASENGYLTIVDIQPNGEVVMLYPNDMVDSNKIKKGTLYTIPGQDDQFKLTVSEPPGNDTLVAFFTTKKVDWLDRSQLFGQGFLSVKEDRRLAATRGISVQATELDSKDWESKVIELEVK